jgi:hypothetical protein
VARFGFPPAGNSRFARDITGLSFRSFACGRRGGTIENLPIQPLGFAAPNIVTGALSGIAQDLVRLGKPQEHLVIPGFQVVGMVSQGE